MRYAGTKTVSINIMHEAEVVKTVVDNLRSSGFQVETEMPNIYRSAVIVAVDSFSKVWVIECKISNVKRAVEQTRIHKLSADKVFIAMPFRKPRESTLQRVLDAGVGLMYVMPDGSIQTEVECPDHDMVWEPAQQLLISRMERGRQT